ncbi:hypothetical protein JG687_00019252, partial [Phytophthora cactorum]
MIGPANNGVNVSYGRRDPTPTCSALHIEHRSAHTSKSAKCQHSTTQNQMNTMTISSVVQNGFFQDGNQL